MKKVHLIKAVIVSSLLIYQTQAQAEVDIISSLSFGQVVLTNNGSVSTIKITADGGYFPSGNLYILKKGGPAEIAFYNYPANSTLYFDVTIGSPDIATGAPGNARFSLEDITADDYKITDASGSTSLKIGGTLKSSGTGQHYTDANYIGFFNINVIYY